MKTSIFRTFMVIAIGAVIALGMAACKDPVNPDKGGKVSVTGVSLNKTTLALAVGDTETLAATVVPANATNDAVTWESDNDTIATVTVNANGTVTVTAVALGSTTITVTTADGGKTASCTVTVKKQEIFTIDFADAAPEIEEPTIHRSSANGPTTATVAVANASDYDSIKWSINGTGISVTGNFIILDSANQAYNCIGKYFLSVEVFKNGVPYNTTVTFKVEE
jgi:hypothetical protein